jgi:hypothetical protein
MSNNSFMIRGIVVNDDIKAAVDLLKRIRPYPRSQRNSPTLNRFVSVSGKFVDTLFPADFAYWERVHSFVDNNPVHERDRFFMAILRPLGIEKGKPFNPDKRQRAILTEAMKVGYARKSEVARMQWLLSGIVRSCLFQSPFDASRHQCQHPGHVDLGALLIKVADGETRAMKSRAKSRKKPSAGGRKA